ncbi:MAG: proton-conducting transporter membrane subunit [Candidatus Saganbacteria bacterium]|nr:proton-conducting transporter membrane subunit [Candidatus Saganbacteria bacterium]
MLNPLNLGLSLIFDPLSIFFQAVIILIAVPAFIYSFEYLKAHYSSKKIILGQVLFVLFIVSMLAVVSVSNVFMFLIAWELMSLISYFLVTFDSEQEKSIQAGTIYIVMTHIGTAFLIAAFFLMYKYCGSFDFSVIKTMLSSMPGTEKNIIFLLLLIGFGTKAGIVPLHIWLPYAHPQAPSHVSCLMSGVMIKTAIYGIIRFIICMLGVSSLWWGELVIVLAAISCLVGVIYALMEHDLKTLLAYHSVENIGIILLGIGSSMLFIKLGLIPLAILAMCAGLYHLVNHAVFKGLLFLCAGSVYNATGTRDMEKLGGLIKKMPWTSAYFLTGSMAISALPPLNGFVSEWLTLIVLFLGALAVTGGLKLFLCLTAAILALTGGLAAACFVKAFGITFLAKPRSVKAESAKECGTSMNLGMGILAFMTVALGIGAAYFIRIIAAVSANTLGAETLDFTLNNFILNPLGKGTYLSTPLISIVFISVMGITLFSLYLFLGKSKVSAGPTWDCGYYKLTSRNEYTATGFSKPFRLAFSFFLLPYKKLQKIKESHYHIKSFRYETHTTKIFRKYFYENLLGGVFNTAKYMRGIQTGSIHLYLGYILITVIILLIFMGRF